MSMKIYILLVISSSFLMVLSCAAQKSYINLIQKPNKEFNAIKVSDNRSDIIWERVNLPENFKLNSFFINDNDALFIGSDVGGNPSNSIFKTIDLGVTWNTVGTIDGVIYFIGQNSVGELLAGRYNRIYKYNEESNLWTDVFVSNTGNCYTFFQKDSLLFVGNGGVIRSYDNGNQWELVHDFAGSAEDVRAFTSTTVDSILMGTTNWVGEGGGIYLSTNSGESWENFGLDQHFIYSMAVDNYNLIYAGNGGHWETGQGGLYRYNYSNAIWDTLHYFPYITSIVFNSENHIYTGFTTSGMEDSGGVMHSEDNGGSWIIDTIGLGNTSVNNLQIDRNGFLYALTGYSTKSLYRTILPVSLPELIIGENGLVCCYPNPVKDVININLGPYFDCQGSIIYMTISNVFGKTVYKNLFSEREIKKGIISIDVGLFDAGFYIYHIESNNIQTVNKFIKH
jgi:type IX secretion system substrate protein